MDIHTIKKQEYTAPIIAQIRLDNEISLALESTPPTFESSTKTSTPEFFNNEPFKNNMA